LEVQYMKNFSLLIAVLVALSGQTPASGAAPVRHLVYEFGYNTKVASTGPGTGTTTIDILGPAKDGGLMVSGSDFWWNTVRARAANACEVYPSGGVNCADRPNAISPIQLTIFSLLGRGYFKGLTATGTGNWKHNYKMYFAIVPGASGTAAQPSTWDGVYTLQGKGLAPAPNPGKFFLVQLNGTLNQEGGRYRGATDKAGIVYDPGAKVPVYVTETRTHLPQTNVYNNDTIQLQLTKDSLSKS
jgi:hypothetical protein